MALSPPQRAVVEHTERLLAALRAAVNDATRAISQLWIVAVGRPSPILPPTA